MLVFLYTQGLIGAVNDIAKRTFTGKDVIKAYHEHKREIYCADIERAEIYEAAWIKSYAYAVRKMCLDSSQPIPQDIEEYFNNNIVPIGKFACPRSSLSQIYAFFSYLARIGFITKMGRNIYSINECQLNQLRAGKQLCGSEVQQCA